MLLRLGEGCCPRGVGGVLPRNRCRLCRHPREHPPAGGRGRAENSPATCAAIAPAAPQLLPAAIVEAERLSKLPTGSFLAQKRRLMAENTARIQKQLQADLALTKQIGG